MGGKPAETSSAEAKPAAGAVPQPKLKAAQLNFYYGAAHVLHDVSLKPPPTG